MEKHAEKYSMLYDLEIKNSGIRLLRRRAVDFQIRDQPGGRMMIDNSVDFTAGEISVGCITGKIINFSFGLYVVLILFFRLILYRVLIKTDLVILK
jgi:hypothetical protein